MFGVNRGSLYALVALGYSMVYGILGLINFAHGEVSLSALSRGGRRPPHWVRRPEGFEHPDSFRDQVICAD